MRTAHPRSQARTPKEKQLQLKLNPQIRPNPCDPHKPVPSDPSASAPAWIAGAELIRDAIGAASASEAPLLVSQIRDRTKLEQHTVRRYLAELVELEYMGVAKGVRGAAASYRLVDLPEKQGGRIPGLLLPEELATRLERPGDEEKASWRSAAEA